MHGPTMNEKIVRAYRETAKPHLVADLPDNTPIQLLVTFKLGWLRAIERQQDDAVAALSAAPEHPKNCRCADCF